MRDGEKDRDQYSVISDKFFIRVHPCPFVVSSLPLFRLQPLAVASLSFGALFASGVRVAPAIAVRVVLSPAPIAQPERAPDHPHPAIVNRLPAWAARCGARSFLALNLAHTLNLPSERVQRHAGFFTLQNRGVLTTDEHRCTRIKTDH